MTYCRWELEELGVPAFARAWRAWRRSMHLTIEEAAAVAGISSNYLQLIELGRLRGGPKTHAKLVALMKRWDESKRPKRKKPDMRGRWPRKGRAA